jgi:hypothetical protein
MGGGKRAPPFYGLWLLAALKKRALDKLKPADGMFAARSMRDLGMSFSGQLVSETRRLRRSFKGAQRRSDVSAKLAND